MLLTILLALSAVNPPAPSASCSVVAQPRLSIAPLRTTRIKVTVDPRADGDLWRQADLVLVGDGMEITSSRLWEGDRALKAPRTTWVNWELPGMAPGEYQVVLVVQAVNGRCMASDKLRVKGPGEPE